MTLPPYTIPFRDRDLWKCGRVCEPPEQIPSAGIRPVWLWLRAENSWKKVAQIAVGLGWERETVRRHLRSLLSGGWVVVRERDWRWMVAPRPIG